MPLRPGTVTLARDLESPEALLFLGWLVALGAGAFSADRVLAGRFGLPDPGSKPTGPDPLGMIREDA